MKDKYVVRVGTPMFAQRLDVTTRELHPEECRVHECGDNRGKFSFFCGAHSKVQRPVSVALMIGGLVVAADGSILGEGKLAM